MVVVLRIAVRRPCFKHSLAIGAIGAFDPAAGNNDLADDNGLVRKIGQLQMQYLLLVAHQKSMKDFNIHLLSGFPVRQNKIVYRQQEPQRSDDQ